MTREQIEYLHETGKMPDYVYYQINGMSPEYNLWMRKKKIYEKLKKRQEQQRQQALDKKQEQEIEKAIDKEIHLQLDKIFEKFLK